jgi:hypothetical protein
VDPFAVLGVEPGASPDDVAAAYRAAAKRFHPDLAGADEQASKRMAEINAAYDEIRAYDGVPERIPQPDVSGAPPAAGAWLDEDTRRALGRELLTALTPRERVALVTDTSTWASPRARLALTDRRLLWLHDDAVTHRVRSLRLGDVEHVEERLQWPRRRRAALHVRTTGGRRLAFADLPPAVAGQLAAAIRAGSPRAM